MMMLMMLRISLFSLMPLMIIVIYIMLSFLKVFGLRGSLQAMPMVGKQRIQGLEGTSGVHYSIHHHFTIIIITKHCLHGSWRQGLRVAESFWRAQNIPSDLSGSACLHFLQKCVIFYYCVIGAVFGCFGRKHDNFLWKLSQRLLRRNLTLEQNSACFDFHSRSHALCATSATLH